jgi:hypothetical protein
LVSDIPAGDGNIAILFFTVYSYEPYHAISAKKLYFEKILIKIKMGILANSFRLFLFTSFKIQ